LVVFLETIIVMPVFWGLIIKAGETREADIPEGGVVTIAQAALTGSKNGESSQIFALVEDQTKFLLATLVAGRTDQQQFDLNFFYDQTVKFEVSGSGEIHLTGYLQALDSEENDENGFEGIQSSDEDEQEIEPTDLKKAPPVGVKSSKFAPEDVEEEDSEEEIQPPPKPQQKKRVNEEPAKKAPESKKQKTGGPAKTADSTGQHKCETCKRSFPNPSAFQQHTAAKHAKK